MLLLSEENLPLFFLCFRIASGIWCSESLHVKTAPFGVRERHVLSFRFQAIPWYCGWKKSCTSWQVAYPLFTSQVVRDFFHQQYVPKPVGFWDQLPTSSGSDCGSISGWTQEPWPATGMIILVPFLCLTHGRVHVFLAFTWCMLRGFGHQGHDEILKTSLAVTSDGSRQTIFCFDAM